MNQYNVDYNRIWEVMNELEMVTSKVCSAREIIDVASEAISQKDYERAETLTTAAYEFLGYYLEDFDKKFKDAWSVTISAGKKLQGYVDQEVSEYEDVIKEREYYEPSMPPWGHSDLEYGLQYTDEELSAMCDKAASDEEKNQCREYNLREAEYYNKRVQLDIESTTCNHDDDSDYCKSSWTDFWEQTPISVKDDKVKKWVLPVEETKDVDTDETEYFVSFPHDLLEAANLKEGDQVEWVDRSDGSYMIRKVTKPLGMDEC